MEEPRVYLSGTTKKTNLVGDIRHADASYSYAEVEGFLMKLEALMLEYKVNLVQVAWNHFADEREKSA